MAHEQAAIQGHPKTQSCKIQRRERRRELLVVCSCNTTRPNNDGTHGKAKHRMPHYLKQQRRCRQPQRLAAVRAAAPYTIQGPEWIPNPATRLLSMGNGLEGWCPYRFQVQLRVSFLIYLPHDGTAKATRERRGGRVSGGSGQDTGGRRWMNACGVRADRRPGPEGECWHDDFKSAFCFIVWA